MLEKVWVTYKDKLINIFFFLQKLFSVNALFCFRMSMIENVLIQIHKLSYFVFNWVSLARFNIKHKKRLSGQNTISFEKKKIILKHKFSLRLIIFLLSE